MKITIEVIPHQTQKYQTVGDWAWTPDGNLEVKVSHLADWKRELLVGLHEVVEAAMCRNDGVKDEDVTAFDIAFENNRQPGDDSEPGDAVFAPYRRQHFVATNIERQMADALGVDWQAYDREVVSL